MCIPNLASQVRDVSVKQTKLNGHMQIFDAITKSWLYEPNISSINPIFSMKINWSREHPIGTLHSIKTQSEMLFLFLLYRTFSLSIYSISFHFADIKHIINRISFYKRIKKFDSQMSKGHFWNFDIIFILHGKIWHNKMIQHLDITVSSQFDWWFFNFSLIKKTVFLMLFKWQHHRRHHPFHFEWIKALNLLSSDITEWMRVNDVQFFWGK